MSDDALDKAKRILPLPELMRRLGDYAASPAETGKGGFLIKSPLREDKNPSFSVYRRDGEWKWSDKATGEGGDALDYLQAREGKDFKGARARLLEMAGVHEATSASKPVNISKSNPKKAMPSRVSVSEPRQISDWSKCAQDLNSERAKEIANWRGYPVEFVEWCRDKGWIGWYKGGPAFPVHVEGVVAGVHHRQIDDPGSWRNTAKKASPLIIGDPKTAGMTILVESQWDALAALAAMRAHEIDVISNLAFIITRGADNTAPVAEILADIDLSKPRLYAVEQNDPPRKDGKPTGNEIWATKISKLVPGIQFNAPPQEHKDLNDWLRAGMTGPDVIDLMMTSRRRSTSKYSGRNAEEIWAMDIEESDNYIADRMMSAGSLCSFIGPGGIGKSRIVLQMAACCILGLDFLGLVTRARGKKWLFIQTENNNRRLLSDLRHLVAGLGLDEAGRKALFRCLDFHTLEHEDDDYIDMEDPENAAHLEAIIFDYQPDIVVIDPLNSFTSEDLNSDKPMSSVVMKLVRAIKKGNPRRVPLIIHHSITGKAGAMKATGWDKSSYGRNSKVLYGKVRSQWNLGKVDPDDETLLVLACGKNNDGKHFEEIGVKVQQDPTFYVVNEDHDPADYREKIGAESGKRAGRPATYSKDDIFKVMAYGPMTAPELKEKVCGLTSMSISSFNRIWKDIRDSSRVVVDADYRWRLATEESATLSPSA